MLLPTPLPPAATLPTQPSEIQTAILSALFEPSPSLTSTLAPLLTTPYPTYPSLIDAIKSHLLSLRSNNAPLLLSILASHPRLGAPKVDSAQSAAEQAQLQGGEEVVAQLGKLNAEYEAAFPGLRFVVFVNGRGRGEIMEIMRERIARGDWEKERDGAVEVRLFLIGLPFLLLSFVSLTWDSWCCE
jgi:2-oxo-4-hydroxy-4-carboxy--5-ureidoimidazoline (OHCU) decarboxylase